MPYNHMYFYSPFSFIGDIVHVAFWVFIIWLIIRLFKRRGRWHHMWEGGAMEVLRERYAKGEINKEEYEERRKVLMHKD